MEKAYKSDRASTENQSPESLENETASRLENIEKSGGTLAGDKNSSIYCLTVIGQIEGHYSLGEGQKATKYEHVIPLLVSIEENDDIDGLLVVLNTVGGDVEAGLAISEMLASMRKPCVTLVLGGGHSIGVPLAVSGKKSFIVPSATMTIHPVRTNGLVVGVPQSFNYFKEMQNRIIKFICNHSRADEHKIYELMMCPDMMATDIGSIISGEEAVGHGIIDEVGGLDSAIAALRRLIDEQKGGKEKSD